jgi:hypothetical protein
MKRPEIERSEYLERQGRARGLARDGRFDAIVAWSRGGSTQDHYADVFYLTGFYTHYPFIPDLPARWRARGHTALFLPVNGPSTLLVDVASRQAPEPVADDIEDVIMSLVKDRRGQAGKAGHIRRTADGWSTG